MLYTLIDIKRPIGVNICRKASHPHLFLIQHEVLKRKKKSQDIKVEKEKEQLNESTFTPVFHAVQ